MISPEVSIVVIGRNEGARLERCLRSVNAIKRPAGGVELLYVDLASTDNSVRVAQLLRARTIVVDESDLTAGRARNIGWRAVRGEFILFLDADAVLDPEFVVRALAAFEDIRVAIVWGHRRELAPDVSIFQRVLDLDWIYPPGLSEFCGGDALMRRSALIARRGFDESLIAGEEPELCSRIRASGGRILHLDLPMTAHDIAVTCVSQYVKRAMRAGYAYAEVSQRVIESNFPCWREAQRNQWRALLLSGLFLATMLASLWARGPAPLFAFASLFAVLVLRSAYESRWKTSSPFTLLLYGIHSHLQQLPIFWGQCQYWRDRKAGKKRTLIEYKGTASCH